MASVTRFVLLILVFTLPFEQAITVSGIGSLGRALGMLAAGSALLALIAGGRVRLRKLSAFLVIMLLFVLAACTSVVWALDRAEALVSATTYLQLWVMAWLIWQFFETPEMAGRLRIAYLLGVWVTVGTVVVHFLTNHATVDAGRYSAFGANANYTALGIAIAIPMALDAAVYGRGAARWLWALLVPASVIGIAFTGSREGLIVGGTGLLVGLLLIVRIRTVGKVAVAAGLVLVVALAATWLPKDTLARFTDVGQQVATANFSGRGKVWRAGLAAWLYHPAMGAGIGNFGAAVTRTLGYPSASHNTFLALLVELGPLGLALFLVAMATAAWPHVVDGLRRLRDPPGNPRITRLYLVVLLVLLLALLPANWQYERLTWFLLSLATLDRAVLLRSPGAPWLAGVGYGR